MMQRKGCVVSTGNSYPRCSSVDRSTLAQLRRHEHVHVRQYERWGPLFIPAYLLSSLVQLLRGRNPYRENHFERQAFALAPSRSRARSTLEQRG